MPKARPSKPWNKVSLSYVRTHMDTLSVEEIAKDLGMSQLKVERKISELKAITLPEKPVPAVCPMPEPENKKLVLTTTPAPPAPAKPITAKARASLDRFSTTGADGNKVPGVAVLTPAQALQDDSDLGASPFGSTVMTEAQKHYIRTKHTELTPEQIAKDVGLLPFEVRQYIEALNPENQGRKKFYDRNKNAIHKLREEDPIR